MVVFEIFLRISEHVYGVVSRYTDAMTGCGCGGGCADDDIADDVNNALFLPLRQFINSFYSSTDTGEGEGVYMYMYLSLHCYCDFYCQLILILLICMD